MNNQSLRGYFRQQTLTATARSYLIRALFFDVETEGQPPAETELWPVLRSMEPGALNVAEQPLQPVADELETDLLTNAPTDISMVAHTAIEHLP